MRTQSAGTARSRSRAHSRVLGVVVTAIVLAGCAGGASAIPSSIAPSLAPSPTPSPDTDELVTDVVVDDAGRTLHLVCLGPTTTGEPTIVFEAGLMAPFQTWSDVLSSMSGGHRVCAYDRAGLGSSPPISTSSRTAADVVVDLRAMLIAAEIAGPVVLVGHSFGALPVTLYAAAHPTEVAGIVLVDPRGPRVSGEWAAALPPVVDGEPASVTANRDELSTFETDPSLNDERLDLSASAAEVIAVLDADGPIFGELPVTVLSAADTRTSWSDLPPELAATFDAIWLAGQQEFADESEAGTLVTVEDSGHEIQREQPAAVIDAIEAMLVDVAGT